MKAKIKDCNATGFKPFIIEVTFDDFEQAKALWMHLNLEYRDAYPLWDALDDALMGQGYNTDDWG